MKLRPIHFTEGRVVVERDAPDEVSKGGILMPDTQKEKQRPQRGKVTAVSSASEAFPVKVGDRVLLKPWTGHPVDADAKEYKRVLLVVDMVDVLAVIELE